MNYLLDTNVISEFARPKPDEHVVRWLESLDEDVLFLSVITLAELRRGVALLPHSRRRIDLDSWLQNDLPARFDGRLLNITPHIAHIWGEMMAQAKLNGFALHAMDALIGATARSHDMVLVTRNTKDFIHLSIDLKNPWLA